MEQAKALAALEPFLALTKSATSPRIAADLVTRATSHPFTFLFADLLASPAIQSLARAPEHAAHLTLLEIFAHGTCRTYCEHASPQPSQPSPPLPPLLPAQATKLRQLSLLTLASDRSNLTYDALIAELALPPSSGLPQPDLVLSVRALEDLVISAIYANLLDGSLDQRRWCVQINSVAPLRDLAPGAVVPMTDALRAWGDRCGAALHELDARVSEIRDNARARDRQARESQVKAKEMTDALFGPRRHAGFRAQGPLGTCLATASSATATEALKSLLNISKGVSGGKRTMAGIGDHHDEAMDLDDDDSGEKKRNRMS